MEALLAEIITRCTAGEKLALCVLVRTRGSTPQTAGAKMIVLADGKTIGTLGGGCVEAEVRSKAIEQLAGGAGAHLYEFRLDHDYGWDDGLICGGIMDIQVRLLDASDVPTFQSQLNDLLAGRSVEFIVPFKSNDVAERYTETIEPAPRLLIAGGGHVGRALATMATQLDFQVTVIDDRPEFVSPTRFPDVSERVLGEIDVELGRARIDERTYIVIVTRGHRNDGRALAAVINSAARYIGLIGSKRKIKTIFDDLTAGGVSMEKIARVHAPIGLEIAAVSPAEIAVSIAAELVAVRRGRDGLAAAPMKMDDVQLRAWLSRPAKSPA